MSIVVTSIKDPFSPCENVKEIYEYSGKTLDFYLRNINLNDEDITYSVYLNANAVDLNKISEIIVEDNSKIAVCAKIEAEAFATWVVGLVAAASYEGISLLITQALYWGSYAAATFAIGYGLNLVASVLTPDIPSLSNGNDNSGLKEQTYGWGDLQQTSREGINIPYIFGTNKVSGQVLNQFITLNGNNETLNLLLGIADHQVDSITDIRINDQPYTSFRDITTDTRLGTNSDAAIAGFGEVVTQTDVNSKLLKDNGISIRTDGDQVEKVIVFITANRGLYYSNNSGGLDARSASFTIQYKLSTDSSWTTYLSTTVTGATTEAQRYSYTIDSLTAGQYDIGVTRTDTPEASYRGSSDLYFTFFQEIIKQELIYPGLAKYVVKALATDQLSGGVPTITCLATRSLVSVYNEITGYWESKRATNPAWIVYSLLNEFAEVPTSKIIWDDFNIWATYCDELVDGVYRFIINTTIYDGNFWEQAQKIAKLGRAALLRRGTRYGVFVDKAETLITDMFGMGNVLKDSFKMQYLPKKDRATGVEIEYTDVDRDYTRQVITIYSDNYLSGNDISQKANFSVEAAVSKDQVIREGVYRINSNLLLNRVITFDAFIDSFACTVGDLFYFNHVIPDYTTGVSGRIIAAGNDDGDGNPYTTLDQQVTIGVGNNYSVLVRFGDNTIVEKIITGPVGTGNSLILSTDWDTIPDVIIGVEQPTYNFGLVNYNKKIYRLTSVTRSDDFVRTLTGVEYIPEIYTNNDNYIIEESDEITSTQLATNVILEENLIFTEFSTYISEVGVSWTPTGSKAKRWVVWLQDLTSGSESIKITTTSFTSYVISEIYLVSNHTYQVYINTEDQGAKNLFSNVKTITIQGKNILPDTIESFYLQNNQLVWTYPGSADEIKGFKLKYGIGNNVSWTIAEFLNAGEFVSSPFTIERTGRVTTYLLKAYDFEDRESDAPAILITNLGDLLVSNVVEETTLCPPFDGDITNGQVISDKLYSVNAGTFWSGISTNNIWKGVSGELFFTTQYLSMEYVERFTPVYPNIPVIIDIDITAPTGYLLYYREALTDGYWAGNRNTNFNLSWQATGSDYRLFSDGSILTEQPYDIKIITNSGSEVSVINDININYDFPDIEETFEDLVIEATGTRVPITKVYKKIKNVGLTLQDDGGVATSLIIADKDVSLGPLIYSEDKDRNKTTANIDVRIKGY